MRSRATAFGAPTSRVSPSRPMSAAGRNQVSRSARLTSPRRASSARVAAQTCRLESPTSSMVKSGASARGGVTSSRGAGRMGPTARWLRPRRSRDRAAGETRPAPSAAGSLARGAAPRTRSPPRPRPRRQPPASPSRSPAHRPAPDAPPRPPVRSGRRDRAAACARPGSRRGRWRSRRRATRRPHPGRPPAAVSPGHPVARLVSMSSSHRLARHRLPRPSSSSFDLVCCVSSLLSKIGDTSCCSVQHRLARLRWWEQRCLRRFRREPLLVPPTSTPEPVLIDATEVSPSA